MVHYGIFFFFDVTCSLLENLIHCVAEVEKENKKKTKKIEDTKRQQRKDSSNPPV